MRLSPVSHHNPSHCYIFANETSLTFLPSLSIGASAKLKGRLEQSRGRGQDVELVVENAQVLGTCDAEVCRSPLSIIYANLLTSRVRVGLSHSKEVATCFSPSG